MLEGCIALSRGAVPIEAMRLLFEGYLIVLRSSYTFMRLLLIELISNESYVANHSPVFLIMDLYFWIIVLRGMQVSGERIEAEQAKTARFIDSGL